MLVTFITRKEVRSVLEHPIIFPDLFCDTSNDFLITRQFKIIVFDERRNFLLTKSTDGWGFPVGRVEWDENTVEEAAQRELDEACALQLAALTLVGYEQFNPEKCGDEHLVAILAGLAQSTSMPLRKRKYVFMNNKKMLERVGAEKAVTLSKTIEKAHQALAHKLLQDIGLV